MRIESLSGVLCCGNICFDIPVWPVEEFRWGTTTWVKTVQENIGGNGANTSFTLGRLGTPVRLFGMTGADAHGRFVRRELERVGVDTSGVGRSPSPTTTTVCIVNASGNRLFLHQLGASTNIEPGIVRLKRSGKFSHFHLANLFSMPVLREHTGELLGRAKAAGLTTTLDTGWDARELWLETVRPCLPHTDLLFVNEDEARMLTGHTEPHAVVRALRAEGATDVIVKLGGEGCVVFAGGREEHTPAFPVEVVDTTGAGDCFAGGFLAALHRGSSYAEAARFANAVGALTVQALGAVSGVLGFEETESWMQNAVRTRQESNTVRQTEQSRGDPRNV